MSEIQLFHCPNCGAPLDLPEDAASVRCPYCNSSVIVPSNLRNTDDDDAGWTSLAAYHINLGDVGLLVANGKKQEAVNILTSQTGLDQNEASDVADAIERGEKIGPLVRGQGATIHASVTTIDQSELLDLVHQGRKIEAIKQLRSQTGMGLKESKDIVDALERGDMMALVNAFSSGMMFADTGSQGAPALTVTTTHIGSDGDQFATGGVRKAAGLTGCVLAAVILGIIAVTVIPIFFALAMTGGPVAAVWSQINPASFASVDLSLGEEGIGPGQFTDPRAVAADQEGNIYVADYSTGRLQSFDSQGGFRWMVNLGDETIVQSMDISSGDVLYVTAQGALRRFEAGSGAELSAFPDPDRHYYFDDVAVSPDGRIALIYGGENLLVLNNDMQPVFEVPQAVSSVTDDSELDSDVEMDALGNLFILGSFNSLVLKYSPAGRYINQFGGEATGQVDGKFQAVGDIAVDMEGRVYVSDINGIQVFDGNGHFSDHFKPVQYAHGLNFDMQDRLYVASNEPQVVRMVLRD